MSLLGLFDSIAMASEQAGKQPEIWELLVLPASFFIIFYFFLIRPQQKKQKAQQELLTNLKPGDEIVTSGGIIAKIKSVSEGFVTIDPGSNNFLKVKKSHVTGLSKPVVNPASKPKPVSKLKPSKT